MTGSPKGPVSYAFVPAEPLKPDTVYKLTVSGVRDLDGLALAPQSIAVRTVTAPGVIRFRPRADAKDAARDATISVRFTEPMDRRATAKAFSVKIGGKADQGHDQLGRIEHRARVQPDERAAVRRRGRGQGGHHGPSATGATHDPIGPRDLPYGAKAEAATRRPARGDGQRRRRWRRR